MRNPERPYAQLLTPVAKSQKLLLRLQHNKLLPAADIIRAQAIFALWQKLLAKNIPSTPWPNFADLLLYPDEQYLALQLWPFGDLTAIEAAHQARHIAGYLLVDARADAPCLGVQGQKLVVSADLADRIGSPMWQWLGGQLSPWQSQTAAILAIALDKDGALDLIGMLRQLQESPWPQGVAAAPPFADLAHAFFSVWRARGNRVAPSRLLAQGLDAAASWLSVHSELVIKTEKGFAIRR